MDGGGLCANGQKEEKKAVPPPFWALAARAKQEREGGHPKGTRPAQG